MAVRIDSTDRIRANSLGLFFPIGDPHIKIRRTNLEFRTSDPPDPVIQAHSRTDRTN